MDHGSYTSSSSVSSLTLVNAHDDLTAENFRRLGTALKYPAESCCGSAGSQQEVKQNSSSSLTFENLQRLGPSLKYASSDCYASMSDDDSDGFNDAASVFSSAASVSSASTAPDEDDAPYTVVGDFGVPVTVYSSLAQAIAYSNARVQQQQEHQPHMPTQNLWHISQATENTQEEIDDDDDEDAYFSMG